jgi:hypothetical protein
MQQVIEQGVTGSSRRQDKVVDGEPIGIFGKLFGCRHRLLSRPFNEKGSAYLSCLECGARRRFDTESFRTSGAFYYPPSAASVS